MGTIENIETVSLDSKDYKIYHLRIFKGTDRETAVSVAENALEKKIWEKIEDGKYRECKNIDKLYGYYLPEKINAASETDIIESIEDVYES